MHYCLSSSSMLLAVMLVIQAIRSRCCQLPVLEQMESKRVSFYLYTRINLLSQVGNSKKAVVCNRPAVGQF